MVDSTSGSTFPSLVTETGLPEDDEEDLLFERRSSIQDEEHLTILLQRETAGNYIQSHVDDWIKIRRSEAIQWIINTRRFLRFQFHTVYLSVTYIDRVLSKLHIPRDKPWAFPLLAIACLSLAAKMNEPMQWSLTSLATLQTEIKFELSQIQRMEVLVLATLNWRMYEITPFRFVYYVISRFRDESSPDQFTSRIEQIICAITKDMNVMAHRSSSIAMAATLIAMDEGLTKESMELKMKTVNQPFDHDDVYICYSRMLGLRPLQLEPANNLENPSKRKRS